MFDSLILTFFHKKSPICANKQSFLQRQLKREPPTTIKKTVSSSLKVVN